MSEIFKAFQRQEQVIRRIVAKYRPNPADIEELTQETFVKGFAAELDNEIHDPERLLFRIAKNLAINAATKKAARAPTMGDFTDVAVYADEAQVDQEEALDSRQRLFVFTQALANLEPELRRALIMRRIEGLKYKQIATRLNVSVATVERRVAAAMVECLLYLRRNGYDPADFGAEPGAPLRAGKGDVTRIEQGDE
jgi:RNA polymerase sigma-70 factor (ECF subfamily)